MNSYRKIYLALAIILLAAAVSGLLLVGERAFAAFFDVWKFNGYQHRQGIDLGANSSFEFLSLCMLGLTVCMPLAIISTRISDKLLCRLVIAASAIYAINALVLFTLLASGLAHLFCGR